MKFPSHLSDTPDEIVHHPMVGYLSGLVEDLYTEVDYLKAEIRLLKGHSPKPVIPPNSNLEGVKSKSLHGVKKTPFSKRVKKPNLIIYATERIKASDVLEGSVFKGYKKCLRQDLKISAHNTSYELES